MECATAYDWPGNIRELENLVERAMIMSRGPCWTEARSSRPLTSASKPINVAGNGTLEEIERAHIRRVLEDTRWQIEGEHGAARVLGLNPSTLRGRLRKLGIRKAS